MLRKYLLKLSKTAFFLDENSKAKGVDGITKDRWLMWKIHSTDPKILIGSIPKNDRWRYVGIKLIW